MIHVFCKRSFRPLSVLGFIIARSENHKIDEVVQAQYDGLHRYLRENPQGAHAALKNIATTLGQYAAATVDSGASGVFFAIVKLAREGVLTEGEFVEKGQTVTVVAIEGLRVVVRPVPSKTAQPASAMQSAQ